MKKRTMLISVLIFGLFIIFAIGFLLHSVNALKKDLKKVITDKSTESKDQIMQKYKEILQITEKQTLKMNVASEVNHINNLIDLIMANNKHQKRDNEIKSMFQKYLNNFSNEQSNTSDPEKKLELDELKKIMEYLIRCCEYLENEKVIIEASIKEHNDIRKPTSALKTRIDESQTRIDKLKEEIEEGREYLNTFANILSLIIEFGGDIEDYKIKHKDTITEEEKKILTKIKEKLGPLATKVRKNLILLSKNDIPKVFAQLRQI
ncbi:MAG: hypothetical protein AB3N34_00485 [Lettuce witches'-broom phytoplasma]